MSDIKKIKTLFCSLASDSVPVHFTLAVAILYNKNDLCVEAGECYSQLNELIAFEKPSTPPVIRMYVWFSFS